MTESTIGRERELAELGGFLDRTSALPAALVVQGEPGIGKTTLWLAGLEAAHERSYQVLAARPAGAETALSFATVGDLLANSLGDVVDELPPPQRHALGVALLLTESGDSPIDRRAVAVALLGALRAMARRSPVLVAMDDVQWLDSSSAAALEFSIRRLVDEPIGFLLTLRVEGSTRIPLGLESALRGERLGVIKLGPLGLDDLHRLIRRRVGRTFNRPTLRRLEQVSGGNPFFALELARALARLGGELAPDEPLPVPESLHELVQARLADLPLETQQALILVAALADPTVDVLGDLDAFEPALAANILIVHGDQLRFTHPLLRSAVYDRASADERRGAHRRLAAHARSSIERARHLALAAEGPHSDAAGALDEAARQTFARGAPEMAAEMASQALKVTAPEAIHSRAERTLDCARYLIAAGEPHQAAGLLEDLLEWVPPGRGRADALLLAEETQLGGLPSMIARCHEALAEVGESDPERRGRILHALAFATFLAGDMRRALAYAREALALIDAPNADRELHARVLARAAFFEQLAEGTYAHVLFERAIRLEQSLPDGCETYESPRTWLGFRHLYVDELELARPLIEGQYARAVERGEEARTRICVQLAELEVRSGNFERALRYAEEGLELCEQSDVARRYDVLTYAHALALAHAGEADAARRILRDWLARIGDVEGLFHVYARGTLGFLELSAGDFGAAHAQLEGLIPTLDAIGMRELACIPFATDYAEALIRIGDLEQAEQSIAELEQRGRVLDRPRVLGGAARARGLLLGARGDVPAALASFDFALGEFERAPLPLERARVHLARGLVLRRAKQKRAAREALEHARALFSGIGAGLWEQRARDELERIGGRPPHGELTPTERQVAELVAAGHTNKEVAAELFMAVRTVEANLSRIYTKLGVRSRTELSRGLSAPRSESGTAPPLVPRRPRRASVNRVGFHLSGARRTS